jgi:hypothetical protein
VKKGEYVENIDLDKNTWNVMIRGDGMTETVVTGSRNFMDGTPTFETATFGKFFNLFSLFSISILFIFLLYAFRNDI